MLCHFPDTIEYYGVDINLKLETTAEWVDPPCVLRRGDARALENVFPGIKFDIVLAVNFFGYPLNDMYAIEDFSQIETEVLRSVYKILKPKGVMIIDDHSPEVRSDGVYHQYVGMTYNKMEEIGFNILQKGDWLILQKFTSQSK